MDFVHLKESSFPGLGNVDAFGYANDFDYTRWVPDTRVHLVNVLWGGDYRNAVKFDTDEERDAWFDSIDDTFTTVLNIDSRAVPDGTMKLPIPAAVLNRYNYLFVEVPMATSEGEPIAYENEAGIRRWYFFLSGVVQLSPNTSQVTLQLDVWTNYINSMDIRYVMLERGHAPLSRSDVNSYLRNPIENSNGLLAADVNFGGPAVSRKTSFVPFGNGEKWLVFLSTCSIGSMSSLGTVRYDAGESFSKPTYYDESGRTGYQRGVRDYRIGGGYDFSNTRTVADMHNGHDATVPTFLNAYALPADKCFSATGNFINRVAAECPMFLQTLKAVLVAPRSMLDVLTQRTVTLCGHTLYMCSGKRDEAERFDLKKSDFGYPERYRDLAKLYTYPYSYLEVTGNDGKKADVRIETTGGLEVHRSLSLAYPYLNMRMFMDGVGGSGSTALEWRDLTGKAEAGSISDADWSEFCHDWQIPTYEVYIDGCTVWQMRNHNSAFRAHTDTVLADYKNAVAQANVARENALDSHAVMKTNSDANADTLVTNTANTVAAAAANVALAVAATNTETGIRLSHIAADTDAKNTLTFAHMENANRHTMNTTIAENETSISTTTNSAAAETGAGFVSGLQGAALPALGMVAATGVGAPVAAAAAVALGVLGGLSASVRGQAMVDNAVASAQTNTTVAQSQTSMNLNNSSDTALANNKMLSATTTAAFASAENDNALKSGQVANNNNSTSANASNNAATIKNSASRLKSVEDANSSYTRDAAIDAAKRSLEAAQAVTMAAYEDSANSAPVAFGERGGDAGADWHAQRGLQVRVKTQQPDAIRQAGDAFLRYGYAYNGIWDLEDGGLNLMPHFTFWKTGELWIDSKGVATDANRNAIERIFENGVTVWSRPDAIGKVSIYENI